MAASRVRIREHELADLEPCCEWQTDPEVGRFVSWLPRTRAEAEASFTIALDQPRSRRRQRYFFAVEEVSSGEMIGDVGYTMRDDRGADAGCFLRRGSWGRGYGLESARHLVEHALKVHGLAYLRASCLVANRASERIIRSIGFDQVRRSERRLRFEIRPGPAARQRREERPDALTPPLPDVGKNPVSI